MKTIWDKLNLKTGRRVVVLDSPESFEPHLETVPGGAGRDEASCAGAEFLLAFATRRVEIEAVAGHVARMAEGDVTVWVAYPKGSSKRYACEFNRDTGWEPLGAVGLEGVRQVAIDDDWSAIRFRRVAFVKTMKRDPRRALTRTGRDKASR